MFCSVHSAAISGVDAIPVTVEADVSDGLPSFAMVGYVSAQVKEAQDRVRTALRNVGLSLPPKRITINLAPGDRKKDGTRFDLPIAAAILLATSRIPEHALDGVMVIGELHLDGSVEAVTGILPSVLLARENGFHTCIIPQGNILEGQIVENIRVVGVGSLEDIISFSTGEAVPAAGSSGSDAAGGSSCFDKAGGHLSSGASAVKYSVDFSDIRGQAAVKRAALISAAGFHNLLLSGPPGSGKSMAAQRIPTILPELTREESLEISQIYSIVGLLSGESPLMRQRPFRAPHHTISPTALCGGGRNPRPGEITLAHRGVLFLDELPEMLPSTLELLRQPLEERQILISRQGGSAMFPASFLLVAACNPCPCGYFPNMQRCTCTPPMIMAYQNRLSQAFLDRIDLRADVPEVSYDALTGREIARDGQEGSSAWMRRAVEAASEIQKERYAGTRIVFNSELRPADLDTYCPRSQDAANMLETAFHSLGLSARGYHRLLRVSRTIADLDGEDEIKEAHVSEAICFRCRDRNTYP